MLATQRQLPVYGNLITSLKATDFQVSVRFDSAGRSNNELLRTVAAPTAPRNPRILSSGDEFPITIGWDTPLQPNGKITTYLIEIFKMGPNTTTSLSVAGSRNSYNISSLDTGNKHFFRVSALFGIHGFCKGAEKIFSPTVFCGHAETFTSEFKVWAKRKLWICGSTLQWIK